jgi:hypothetical protein
MLPDSDAIRRPQRDVDFAVQEERLSRQQRAQLQSFAGTTNTFATTGTLPRIVS